MNKTHDDYRRLERTSGESLHECPVCASDAELWQFSESETVPTKKVVMCTRGDSFGPQLGIVNVGCLLYMPPEDFYKATIRDAVRYWNDYAKELLRIQRSGRWARGKVLRADNGGPVQRIAPKEVMPVACSKEDPGKCWNVRCRRADACVDHGSCVDPGEP